MIEVARERVKERFSRAALEYDRRATLQREQTEHVYAQALTVFSPAARVIDLGCGTGYFAELAEHKRPKWKIFGVDLAFGMCRKAAERCTSIQADAVALPFAEASCDGVVSSLCLQWITDLPKAASEIARVLKPGGKVVITTFSDQTLRELRRSMQFADLPMTLLSMYSPEQYAQAFRAYGFEVLDQARVPAIRYYENVHALLDSMRAIGAGANFKVKPKGLLSVRRWRVMLKRYDKLRMEEGIPATWDMLHLVLEKTA